MSQRSRGGRSPRAEGEVGAERKAWRARRQERAAALAEARTGGEGDQQQVQDKNRSNMEILSNTIQKAAEATALGDSTLVQLDIQREQLLRIDDDLFTINETLGRCERSIKGMSSLAGAFSNMFGKKVSKEVDTRFGRKSPTPSSEGQDQGKLPEIPLPKNVNNSKSCTEQGIYKTLEGKGRFTLKLGESLLYHYCNTNKASFMIKDTTTDCVLLTNMRLVRIEGDEVVSDIFIPDIVSVEHDPRKTLQYDHVVLKLKNNFEEAVEVWGFAVAGFFKQMLEIVIQDLAQRRETRSDKELETRAKYKQNKERIEGRKQLVQHEIAARNKKPEGMSDLEWKFEQDKREEDGQLDILSTLVDGLGERAKAIGTELDSQKKLIDHIGDQVDKTDVRIQANDKKLHKLLKK